MFLNNLITQNPRLIEVSVQFHQSGLIPANTYVIDLDTLEDNARKIKQEADRCRIKIYFMTKQLNRNPVISSRIAKLCSAGAVAVDVQGAKDLHRHGIPIGHVGHLVQIPTSEIRDVLLMDPEVFTVYSREKAVQISNESEKLGRKQKILLRIRGKSDIIFPIEDGGFSLDELDSVYDSLSKHKGIEVVGTTAFPCTVYNEHSQTGTITPNFLSVKEAAERLKNRGARIEQLNTAGESSTSMIEVVAKHGGTHIEPGHGFTATTPWHLTGTCTEIPCMIYVNEVSHVYNNRAYIFGGGFYRDGLTGGIQGEITKLKKRIKNESYALVSNSPKFILNRKYPTDPNSFLGCYNATDYMSIVETGKTSDARVGDSVIYGFRPQIFVTRANVAVIRNLHSRQPELVGVFDRTNNLLNERFYPLPNSQGIIREMIGAT